MSQDQGVTGRTMPVHMASAHRDDAYVAWQQLREVYGPQGAHLPDAAKRWLDAYLRWERAFDATVGTPADG